MLHSLTVIEVLCAARCGQKKTPPIRVCGEEFIKRFQANAYRAVKPKTKIQRE